MTLLLKKYLTLLCKLNIDFLTEKYIFRQKIGFMDKNIIFENGIETEIFPVPSTSSNGSAHTHEIVKNNDIYVNPSANQETLSQKSFNQNLDIENNLHNSNRESISGNQKNYLVLS
ncbi:hypothetical protein CWI36_0284p0010 [Hamiltosporidium magnivora]|uniref:Uncharacterized protein n=1 Tax=Hamiltosporidium magnivora TaxID=148818 RepID=A0A4Q9LDA4_9MICR|nr:hypothetical protein CWI36_0545p0010 [Hamiltosporidium magnivora]TBU07057.1 hypothetical protein CWI36_0334p0020 [Hamiltosporidium magnivora]TBU07375.1 hypothetical protein CWI36_0284p0010 [Hamiltosporidium magnivora]